MVTREVVEQKNKFFNKIIILLIVVFVSLSLTRVVLSNILATSGQRLAAANQKIKILREQNQKLENQISKTNSLSQIEKVASDNGMVKAKNVEVLVPSLPIANR